MRVRAASSAASISIPRPMRSTAMPTSRHDVIVARQNLHLYAGTLKSRDRRAGTSLWWIKERNISKQREIILIHDCVNVLVGVDFLVRHSDDSKAIRVERYALLLRLLKVAAFKRTYLAVDFVSAADRKHFLDRPLTDQDVFAVIPIEHDRQATADEVERYLVELVVLVLAMQVLAKFRMPQHRNVEEVLQTRLIMAVQISVLQHAIAVFAANVEVPLEDDPVLGQRSGLVGAQYVHGAEILDRMQPFDA